MRIPFVDLNAQYETIKPEIDQAISKVISETAFIGGKYVKEFETVFADLYGVENVVSCANGTDSLFIIMKMLGIGQGDEVITVANSWISSSETISQTGARPVFVDISPDYYSMDETQLASKINEKTRAVIAVHLQGQMCNIVEIKRICDEFGVHLIEDCAQSHFSTFHGKRAGLFGVAGSFSFYPGKNLGAYGDAGCIISNSREFADSCRRYANHGALKKHHHDIEGINSRMDGLQAAILTVKLNYILNWTEQRIKNATYYHEFLKDIPEVVTPKIRPGTSHSWHLYVVRVKNRDELMSFLRDREIESAIHYPVALPNLKAYSYLSYSREDFPVASAYESEILSLPMYPELTKENIEVISHNIRSFYAQG